MATAGSSLHLLSIDLQTAPSRLRAALELKPRDVEHWLEGARKLGVPLAIVCGPDRIDLYSSDEGRHAAFKPLLSRWWLLGGDQPGFRQIRTRSASGPAVVRHLLRQAAGLESTEHGLSYAGAIRAACTQAQRFATLSDDLFELLHLALSTAERSESETELGAPSSTPASRELDALTAERILEEQLVAFQLSAANDVPLRSSLPPRSSSLPPYSTDERGSCVRLRISPFSLLPLSERKSG
jgi:glutamyl-tRNA reductase